ncbi:MAG: TM2 domain-containing protein [Myxococcales bacterium]|nr:TM2 domain-containing protein [Myxococcales bacterium]
MQDKTPLSPDVSAASNPAIQDDLWKHRVRISNVAEPKTSYKTAYILLFTLGWLGIHRYYLRRWLSAILYTFTFGFFGFGILADILLTFFMVREARAREMGLELKATETAEDQPTWVSTADKTNYVSLVLRLGLFVAMPPVLVWMAIALRLELLVAMTVLLLLFSFVVGSVDLGLTNAEKIGENPIIQRIPFLPTALATIRSFQEHYSENKPRSIFYYVFFPIIGIPMLLFSKQARREFRVYWGIVLLLGGGILLDTINSYSMIYPPYTGFKQAFVYTLAILFFVVVLSTSMTMLTVTTSFYLSMTGKQRTLRIFSGITAIITLLFAYTAYKERHGWVSFRGNVTLKAKLESERFRRDIRPIVEMFSRYYAPKNSLELCAAPGVNYDDEQTKLLRRGLAGLLRPEERPGYHLVHICPTAGRQRPWLGFIVSPNVMGGKEQTTMIYVSAPNGYLYSRWNQLPPQIQNSFVIGRIKDSQRYQPNQISHPSLLEDIVHFPPTR